MNKTIKLDEYQLAVYNFPLVDKECLTIEAVAGSGKSTTVIAKSQKLIQEGINPSSILLTTFSSKSVLDLKHKYKRMYPQQLKIPQITTLHGLGIKVLKDYLGIKYQLMNEGASVALMKKCITDLGFIDEGWFSEADLFPFAKTVLDFISLYKEQNLGQGLELLEDINFNIFEYSDKGTNYFNRIEFKEIAKYYDEVKQEKGLFDFSDLVYEAYYHLKEDEELLKLVKSSYEIAIIDEAQDLNQLQWDILLLLFSDKKFICVGDMKQNIYNFRYSKPENFTMEYLSKFFNKVHSLSLAYNYRSTKEIVEVGNIIRKIGGNDLTSIAFKESKPASVEFTEVYDNIQEGTKVAELIKGLIDAGYKYSDISVIVRTNTVIRDIIQPSLIKENIPYKMNNATAGTKLLDRLSSDVYFNALSVIYDKKDWFSFVDLIRQILPNNEPFISKLVDNISLNNSLDFKEDIEDKKLMEVIRDLYDSLIELGEGLEGYEQAGNMLLGLYHILYKLTDNRIEIRKDLSVVYKTILNFWYGLKEEFKGLSVHKTLEAMILRARDYDNDIESDKVSIGSIHSYKGAEGLVSIVCGFTSFRPKKDVHNDLANMLYVQCSRAMEKLYIINSYNYVADQFKVSAGYIDANASMLKLKYKNK